MMILPEDMHNIRQRIGEQVRFRTEINMGFRGHAVIFGFAGSRCSLRCGAEGSVPANPHIGAGLE